MPDRIRVDLIENLPPGAHRGYALGERRVAVFNVGGTLYAVDDRCPHRGASLGRGTVQGSVVACPLHGWEFDVATGEPITQPGPPLGRHDVFVAEGEVFVELADRADSERGFDGIHRCLVRYGAMGWVGRFGSVEPVDCGHGDRVVVLTRRGVEAGEVLARSSDPDAPVKDGGRPTGELLRRFTAEDERQGRRLRADLGPLIDECGRLLAERELDVDVIDGERLFDGETVVLYFLGEPVPALDALAADLSAQHAAQVLFEPALEPGPAPSACGSGCGGCSS